LPIIDRDLGVKLITVTIVEGRVVQITIQIAWTFTVVPHLFDLEETGVISTGEHERRNQGNEDHIIDCMSEPLSRLGTIVLSLVDSLASL
jgi:hypothetical protein